MKSSEYNYGSFKTQEKEPCHKRALNGIKNTFNKVIQFSKTKPIIFGLICLAVLIVLIIIIVAISSSGSKKKSKDICSNRYSDECLYEKMIAKQKEYPEGMKWDNSDFYAWKGGIYSGGSGCAGFAFMLSDVCFDDIKANKMSCPNPKSLKVGDIIRVNNDSHSVIILKIDKDSNSIIIAEGNYNNSVHWGRVLTFQSMQSTCTYILRRNPN